jgi:hypothetical protein
MSDLIKEIARALKQRLRDTQGHWVKEEDWNGNTEAGFYSSSEVDMEQLDWQIDALCEEFAEKQKVKP